jgi:hypothetical protein
MEKPVNRGAITLNLRAFELISSSLVAMVEVYAVAMAGLYAALAAISISCII